MWVEVWMSVGIAITADNLSLAGGSLVGARPVTSESMTFPVPTGTLRGFKGVCVPNNTQALILHCHVRGVWGGDCFYSAHSLESESDLKQRCDELSDQKKGLEPNNIFIHMAFKLCDFNLDNNTRG